MTTMRVVGECFFWYRLTRVFPDKFHRAVKRMCVCVCGFYPGLPVWASIRKVKPGKVKPIRIYWSKRDEWQWHQQICTSPQTHNHASIPLVSFYRPDANPTDQRTALKHRKKQTEELSICKQHGYTRMHTHTHIHCVPKKPSSTFLAVTWIIIVRF